MRYLGLDIGRKKIGVATGEVLAQELTTLSAPANDDFYSVTGTQSACTAINKLIAQEETDAIVAGLPVSEAGEPTEESKLIQAFCVELEKATNHTVHFVDETLTSFMAEDILSSGGASPEEIRKREHQLAAQLILQQFLEENA